MSRAHLVCLAGAILFFATPSLAQDPPEFHAFLSPSTSTGEVGDTVTVAFEVDETAVQFNAYDVEIRFDPDIVSFLSVAQGSLMLNACPNNFTNWTITDSTISYSHSLLCGVPSIDGPGILSLFEFRIEAEGTSPLTILTDPDRAFFDAGFFIWPQHPFFPRQVVLQDAQITTDPINAVDETIDRGPLDLTVRVVPNPVLDTARLELRAPAGDRLIELDILDATGRSLRRWTLRPIDGGQASQRWDATDTRGRAVPNGTYFFLARSESAEAIGKIQVIR